MSGVTSLLSSLHSLPRLCFQISWNFPNQPHLGMLQTHLLGTTGYGPVKGEEDGKQGPFPGSPKI